VIIISASLHLVLPIDQLTLPPYYGALWYREIGQWNLQSHNMLSTLASSFKATWCLPPTQILMLTPFFVAGKVSVDIDGLKHSVILVSSVEPAFKILRIPLGRWVKLRM